MGVKESMKKDQDWQDAHITVNRDALAALLKKVDPGGFWSNELEISFDGDVPISLEEANRNPMP